MVLTNVEGRTSKTAYEKAFYPKGNYPVFRKVIGEASKNHQAGSEDLTNSGLIPFCANEFGFNPGALLETYLEVLHPEYEFMFQRPRRAGKNFNINTAKVLFEDSKLGIVNDFILDEDPKI